MHKDTHPQSPGEPLNLSSVARCGVRFHTSILAAHSTLPSSSPAGVSLRPSRLLEYAQQLRLLLLKCSRMESMSPRQKHRRHLSYSSEGRRGVQLAAQSTLCLGALPEHKMHVESADERERVRLACLQNDALQEQLEMRRVARLRAQTKKDAALARQVCVVVGIP